MERPPYGLRKEKRIMNRQRPEFMIIKPAKDKTSADILQELRKTIKPDEIKVYVRSI